MHPIWPILNPWRVANTPFMEPRRKGGRCMNDEVRRRQEPNIHSIKQYTTPHLTKRTATRSRIWFNYVLCRSGVKISYEIWFGFFSGRQFMCIGREAIDLHRVLFRISEWWRISDSCGH